MPIRTVKCPWCHNEVGLTPRNNVSGHVGVNAKKCAGTGRSYAAVDSLNELMKRGKWYGKKKY